MRKLSKPMTDEAQNNGAMSTEKPKKKRKRALSKKAQKMVKLPVQRADSLEYKA